MRVMQATSGKAIEEQRRDAATDAWKPSVYRGVPVLLTGATGFIGGRLWRYLSDAGADLTVAARSEAKLDRAAAEQRLGGRRVAADLADEEAVCELVAGSGPAIIFNAAGYGVAPTERDPEVNKRINADLPAGLATAIGRGSGGWRGQRLVHIGSAFEYGSVAGEVTEETEAKPASPYAAMKLRGTRELAAAGEALAVRTVTARVCTVYGPGEHSHRLLPSLLRAGAAREPMRLTAGEQERDFTYVDDIAEGLLRIGALPQVPPVLNLATGSPVRVRDFATVAYRIASGDVRQLDFGAMPYRDDEVWQGPVSVERLRGLAGWVPETSIEAGIRATHEAFLAGGE